MELLQQHNISLKPEKCEFEKSSMEYLGVIVSHDLVKMQLIYLNQSYLLHFSSKNHVFWTCFDRKPVGVTGAGAGGCPITWG